MKLQTDDPHYKWLLMAVLFLAASLNYADRGILTAVLPLLNRDLGMSDLALAAIGSFFLWSYALRSPLAGFIGDRFSRSALVTISVAVWRLVTILTGLVNSSGHQPTMRVLLGVTESSMYRPPCRASRSHGQLAQAQFQAEKPAHPLSHGGINSKRRISEAAGVPAQE